MVAAGSGVRLGGGVPKALRPLAGRPLVRHAVERLVEAGVETVVVLVPEAAPEEFAAALAGVEASVRLVVGGAERQDSVRLGLVEARAVAGPQALVLVHDAARPLVPLAVVTRVVEALRAGAVAVTPTVAVVDSIRALRPGHEPAGVVVDRSTLRAVQTPQGFRLGALIDAHDRALAAGLSATDDIAVCEAAGHVPVLVDGDRRAFKITEPFDLELAEALLRP